MNTIVMDPSDVRYRLLHKVAPGQRQIPTYTPIYILSDSFELFNMDSHEKGHLMACWSLFAMIGEWNAIGVFFHIDDGKPITRQRSMMPKLTKELYKPLI